MLIITESSNFSKFYCSKYYVQILIHFILFKLTEFFQIWRTADFRMKFVPKIYEQEIARNITHQNRN